jgi:2-methylisocitrate lyase-like PEP mutase family enzyme
VALTIVAAAVTLAAMSAIAKAWQIPLAVIIAVLGNWLAITFLHWRRYKWERAVYPVKLEEWQASWVCHRCGAFFRLD